MGSSASAPLNVDALRSPPPPPPPRYLIDSCPAVPAPLPAEVETPAPSETPQQNESTTVQGGEVACADGVPEGLAAEGGFDGTCATTHVEGVPQPGPEPGLDPGPTPAPNRVPEQGGEPGLGAEPGPGLLPPRDENFSAKRARTVLEGDGSEHVEGVLKKMRVRELREAGVASEDAGLAALAAEVNVSSRDTDGEAADVTAAPTREGVAADAGGTISPDTLEPVDHPPGMTDDAAFAPDVLDSAVQRPLDDSPSFQAAFQGFPAASALDTGATIGEGVDAVSNGEAAPSSAPAPVAPAPAAEDATATFNNTMANMWAVTLPASSALVVDSPLIHIPAGVGGGAPLAAAPADISHSPAPPLPPASAPPLLGANAGGGGGGSGDAPLMPAEVPVACDASPHLGFFATSRSIPPGPPPPSTTTPISMQIPMPMSMSMPVSTPMPTPPLPAAAAAIAAAAMSEAMYGSVEESSPSSVGEGVAVAGAPCEATAHGCALPTPYDFLPMSTHQLLHSRPVSAAAAAAAAAAASAAAAAATFGPAAAAAVAVAGKAGTSHSYSGDSAAAASAAAALSTAAALLQPPPPPPLEPPEPTALGGGLDGVISNPSLIASPFFLSSDSSAPYPLSATVGGAPKARARRTRCDTAGGENPRKIRNRPTCITDGCRRRPLFGVEGTRQARCCSNHKEPGMVNVLCRRCEVGGCKHQPSFGVPGSRPMRCSSHKLEGMMNVAAQRCLFPGCRVVPSFGKQAQKKPTVCAAHRQKGDVDLVTRRCHHEGCVHRPVFGNPSENKAYYCASHKLEGMVNVFAPRCEFPVCLHQPSWGLPGAKKPTHCAKHRSQEHEHKR